MSRQLAPCGTPAAYRRHLRHGETPDPECKAAMRAFDRAYRRNRGFFGHELAPCGTPAAARRHWRRGEPLDQACLNAGRRDNAERNGMNAGTHSPDFREIRNGLPEFVPYVYRGLGYDRYEEAS